MNNLKLVVENGKLVADSREVADMIGKRHDHLVRDIDGYVEVISENSKLSSWSNTPNLGASDFFIPSTYKQAGNGKAVKCYKLTKQGCEMVANKLTGKKGILFTAAYVQKFNEMENEISNPAALPNFNNPAEAARAWADQFEKREVAEKQIEENRPKVIFADSVSVSNTSILIGDLAKILHQNGINNIGQNRLFAWMRENKYLISRDGSNHNMPTQKAMEMGLFKIKETSITHSDGHVSISKTVKVTGKGQIYFVNKFLATQATA